MALATYADLKASMASWLHRADLSTQIPDFIALAEGMMSRKLRVRKMIARSTATLTDEYSAVPADFMGVRTFSISDGPDQLRYLTPAQMDQAVTGGQVGGSPVYYSIVGTEFRFYPATDASAELTYWQRIPALSDGNTTNWLLTDHPDAYLYGALLQAAPYLRDDDRAATWGSLFTTALNDIKAADDSESYGDLNPTPSIGCAP